MITVNGEPIDPDLVEETFLRIKSDEEARHAGSCCERDGEFHRRAEDEVIDGILLAQEAERSARDPDSEEVRAAMDETIRNWRAHGASWDMLEHQRDTLRQEAVADLRMRRFLESVWRGLPALGEADERRWFGENHHRFRRAARADVLHLVRFPGERPADEVYRRMLDLRRRALAGEDFLALAREHTEKADGVVELGWIEHERVLNPFEAMLFSLQEGEVGPVFFYEQAFHLIRVRALEPERIPDFDAIREEVAELALADQRKRALDAIVAGLREHAVIERGEA